MKENGGGGRHTELGAGEEGGADCEAVQEVVSAVGQEVEVANYLLVLRLPHLGVGLGVTQLQHLLQEEECEDPTQYGASYPAVAILLLVIHHLKDKLWLHCHCHCSSSSYVLISLREEVEEHIAQQTSHSKPQEVLEVLLGEGTAQLARQEEEGEDSSQSHQN